MKDSTAIEREGAVNVEGGMPTRFESLIDKFYLLAIFRA